MTQMDWLNVLTRVAVIGGFVSITGWVILYTKLAKWWKNPIGRALVGKSVLLASFFGVVAISIWWKPAPGWETWLYSWVALSLLALVTPVMLYRSVVWFRLYRIKELPEDYRDPERNVDRDSPSG